MQVRMVIQAAAVGVQHGRQSQPITEGRIVPAEGRHPEQGGIGPLGVGAGEAPQLGR